MKPEPREVNPDLSATNIGHRIHKVVLRLVKGGPERRAIAAGQVDAILDPESGHAFLLPGAQRWLLDQTTHRRLPPEDHRLPAHSTGAILDGLAAEICALDASGVVVSTNRAWRCADRDCLGAGVAHGGNYLASCENAQDRVDGIALAAGIRQIIAGQRQTFRYEHACGLPGTRCWFTFNVTLANGDSVTRAIVLRENITWRKRGELLLELEYAVARGLAEADDATNALKTAIRAVCESQDWDCGRYFRLDPADSMLHHHESWGIPTPAVEQFLDRSRGVVLRPGAGLTGRVYRTGQPLWVVAGAANSAVAPGALAPESDEDGGFFFPVTCGNRTIGVLAFSGNAIREPDDRLLQTVRAIGAQLGWFLVRQQRLDALALSEARFRRLTDLSTDWYWEQNRDYRFTEYVESGNYAGNEILGKTLWELPNIVPASADWEAHRAQLGERWSFCDFEFSRTRADGQPRYYCVSGEPIFDETGTFTGYRGTGVDITERK